MGKISVFITFGLGVHCSETTHIPNHSKSTSKTKQHVCTPKETIFQRSRLHVNIQPKPIKNNQQIQISNSIPTSSSFLGCITSSGIRRTTLAPQRSCQGSRRRPSDVPARQRLSEAATADGREANNSWVARRRRLGKSAYN